MFCYETHDETDGQETQEAANAQGDGGHGRADEGDETTWSRGGILSDARDHLQDLQGIRVCWLDKLYSSEV